MNYDIEINGEMWVSVKGTAKSYKKHLSSIHDHIKNHPEIFDNHIIDLMKNSNREKHKTNFSKSQIRSHSKWLDKFAFYKIGTLLKD